MKILKECSHYRHLYYGHTFFYAALLLVSVLGIVFVVCSWHKNMREMQVGEKGDSQGWEVDISSISNDPAVWEQSLQATKNSYTAYLTIESSHSEHNETNIIVEFPFSDW